MAEHAPMPWAAHSGDLIDANGYAFMDASLNSAISRVWQDANPDKHWASSEDAHRDIDEDENEANAAFIIRAVNAHDDLVAALKGMTELYCELANSGDAGFWDPEDTDEVKVARAALSKAEA